MRGAALPDPPGPGTVVAPAPYREGSDAPAPTAPLDQSVGVRCDTRIHGEPIVDEVAQRMLAADPARPG
ncbi:hypothetical protein [Streptomyces sp. NPDC005181]|uniref:hypothetical protein n=1 Tax=Streptomyces sp. NPDC005181 TaxID=3156869 RepID=UPI0033B51D14